MEMDGGAQFNGDRTELQANNKKILLSIGVLLIVVATFVSGYLIGSGQIKLSFDNGAVPEISRYDEAPDDGLDQLYSALKSNYDGSISDEDALIGLKSGLVAAAGDPYTEYLSPEEKTAFEEGLNGSFEGIGAELSREGTFIIVVSPIKGTPAFRAGIQPRDIIVEIDGESATGITVSEAVNRIRGPKGEEVVLGIVRNGQQLDVPIIRDTISIPSVEVEMNGDIGIITVGRFGTDTNTLMEEAAQELKEKGAKAVILDLRGNPGGLLDSAVHMSGLWLESGKDILLEKRGDEVVKRFTADGSATLKGLPTVVLINGGSASASEIVAGALHDNGAATLIGEQSFGKGSVQRLIDLSDGGSLKVTIARWYTPSDKNIDKEGITPDQKVELTPEDLEADRDPQLDAALKSLREKL